MAHALLWSSVANTLHDPVHLDVVLQEAVVRGLDGMAMELMPGQRWDPGPELLFHTCRVTGGGSAWASSPAAASAVWPGQAALSVGGS